MPESFALDRWGDFPEDEQFELADELSDAWAHVGGYRPSWVLQIGGHPVSPQNDPVHYARTPEEAGLGEQDGTAHAEAPVTGLCWRPGGAATTSRNWTPAWPTG